MEAQAYWVNKYVDKYQQVQSIGPTASSYPAKPVYSSLELNVIKGSEYSGRTEYFAAILFFAFIFSATTL